jgi:hypothetical protein
MTQSRLEIGYSGQEAIIHIDEVITLNKFTLNLKKRMLSNICNYCDRAAVDDSQQNNLKKYQ